MKIVFTSTGDNLEAPLDERFGRAQKLIVVESDDNSFVVIDNRGNLNAAQGAGIQTAEAVARSGAKALMSGHCGPKAFRVLSAAGIKVYTSSAPTVAEALNEFKSGKLVEAKSANVDGHW